ncbi:MAG TPA: hypothetical protein DIU15_08120 [Deltaproteobacteria bacterium]|nr:hypothetical protein [Deltaproteobacteria bacterium]HCP45990.1 hypothetical protein [Deltaproteobacteria bacterium]
MGARTWILFALIVPLGWLVPQQMGLHVGVFGEPLLSGLAIVAAAFLLSWATELAELYVPPAFALIVLALVSVLPEYAVDMHFAWVAGHNPEYIEYAVANMTGANRLLIGIGWSALAIVHYFKTRQKSLDFGADQRLALGFMLVATLYSFILPFKATLSLWDTAVFFAIFLGYVWQSLKTESEEHPLIGPAAWIGERTSDRGRITVIFLFMIYACGAIWMAAEPFAEGLVFLGKDWGIEEFLLIQIVAPLASEAPELIVAVLFVLRGRAAMALGALISSKVNQWTLLVGAIPIAFSASRGTPDYLPLLARPQAELLLTSAQSLFAIVVLCDLRFTVWEAMLLFGLFAGQFLVPMEGARYVFAGAYFVLVLVMGFSNRERRQRLIKLLRLTPHEPQKK